MRKFIGGCKRDLFIIMSICLIASSASAVDVQMNGDVNVSGDITAGNISAASNMTTAGSVTATTFSGSGAGLTNIPGGQIVSASINTTQLLDNAVTAAKLASDSVTPVKVAFYIRMAIVAQSGGDYSDPSTAMAHYADWCPSPAASAPCLLKIMPGIYTVSSSVVMQPYTDIEGSGENTTVIKGDIDSSTSGIINGASNAEVRFLTVNNTGGASHQYAIAIYNANASAVKIANVTATSAGGTWNYGILNSASSPTMLNVTAAATGGSGSYAVLNGAGSSATMMNVKATSESIAVYNSGSSAILENVRATATGASGNVCAVNNYGNAGTQYTVTIRNSILDSNVYAISKQDNFDTRVSNTEIRGSIIYNTVPPKCMGVYNSSYTTFYSNACP